jgi:hypothetical protein
MSARLRLDHLRRTFEKFRRAHRPRTRIPQDLREEALEALRRGVSESDVRRACRVTPEQLEWWRRRRRRRSGARTIAELDERAVRIFPVVDEEQEAGASEVTERAAGQATQHLELRIGGWAICIRPVEA